MCGVDFLIKKLTTFAVVLLIVASTYALALAWSLTTQEQLNLQNNMPQASVNGTNMGNLGNNNYGNLSGFTNRAVNPVMANTPMQVLQPNSGSKYKLPASFSAGVYCNSAFQITINMQQNPDGSVNVSANGSPIASNAIDICDDGFEVGGQNQQYFNWSVDANGNIGNAPAQTLSNCKCISSQCNTQLLPTGALVQGGVPNIPTSEIWQVVLSGILRAYSQTTYVATTVSERDSIYSATISVNNPTNCQAVNAASKVNNLTTLQADLNSPSNFQTINNAGASSSVTINGIQYFNKQWTSNNNNNIVMNYNTVSSAYYINSSYGSSAAQDVNSPGNETISYNLCPGPNHTWVKCTSAYSLCPGPNHTLVQCPNSDTYNLGNYNMLQGYNADNATYNGSQINGTLSYYLNGSLVNGNVSVNVAGETMPCSEFCVVQISMAKNESGSVDSASDAILQTSLQNSIQQMTLPCDQYGNCPVDTSSGDTIVRDCQCAQQQNPTDLATVMAYLQVLRQISADIFCGPPNSLNAAYAQ